MVHQDYTELLKHENHFELELFEGGTEIVFFEKNIHPQYSIEQIIIIWGEHDEESLYESEPPIVLPFTNLSRIQTAVVHLSSSSLIIISHHHLSSSSLIIISHHHLSSSLIIISHHHLSSSSEEWYKIFSDLEVDFIECL